jgi:hypothetical protein
MVDLAVALRASPAIAEEPRLATSWTYPEPISPKPYEVRATG